uniref:Uncharacterized protein n=1 Tax=Bracon brevicornis TaxID=1563983 RepID=A0A6V7LZH1_9HYME
MYALRKKSRRGSNDLTAGLSEDVNLHNQNWTVHEAAIRMKPRALTKVSVEVKTRKRIEKLQREIELARKQASRIQIVAESIISVREFTPRIRRIAAKLHYQHYTLNKAILLVIK